MASCEKEKSEDIVKVKDGSKEVLEDNSIGKGQTSTKDRNSVETNGDSDVFEEGVTKGTLDHGEAVDGREKKEHEAEGRREQTEESRLPLLHSTSGMLPDSLTNMGWNDKSLHQSDCSDDEVTLVVSSEEDFGATSLSWTRKQTGVQIKGDAVD